MKYTNLPSFCFALLCVLTFVGVCNANDEQTTENSFRVASFNILMGGNREGEYNWDRRKDTLFDVIKTNDPALLGVQEAFWFQVEDLNNAFSEYGYIGVGRDDGDKDGEIMAIFYKKERFELLDSGTFWLSETPDVPGKGWDAACNRTVTWGKFQDKQTQKTFVYANTHLDHVGTKAREESAKLILRRMNAITKGEGAFFVSGDFNVTDQNDAYVTIVKGVDDIPGLIDSNKVAPVRDVAQEQTFNDFGVIPPEKGVIIDYIFVNDQLNVEKFKINPTKHSNGRIASDHVAIVATLSVK